MLVCYDEHGKVRVAPERVSLSTYKPLLGHLEPAAWPVRSLLEIQDLPEVEDDYDGDQPVSVLKLTQLVPLGRGGNA